MVPNMPKNVLAAISPKLDIAECSAANNGDRNSAHDGTPTGKNKVAGRPLTKAGDITGSFKRTLLLHGRLGKAAPASASLSRSR